MINLKPVLQVQLKKGNELQQDILENFEKMN